MIRRICKHGAERLKCQVEDCHHTPCDHGLVAHKCGPCKYARGVIAGLERDALPPSKKDQHRARFRAEPVVCVWGEP